MEKFKTDDVSKTYFDDLLTNYDYFLFDCDGVLWVHKEEIKFSLDAIRKILEHENKKVFYITNNSTETRNEITKKFKLFNIETQTDVVYCSPFLTAQYIKHDKDIIGRKILVLGEKGLFEELTSEGLNCVRVPDLDQRYVGEKEFRELEIDLEIDTVVIGVDFNFSYYRLTYASLCVQNGAKLISTNKDSSFKTYKGLFPGGGSLARCIEIACGQKAKSITKPHPFTIDLIMKEHNITDKNKMIMFGDRLDTDIQLGINGGIDTCLVMSGCTDEKTLEEMGIQPTYKMPYLGFFKNA